MSEAQDAWELALILLASQLPHSTFEQWVRPLYVSGVAGDKIVLRGPRRVAPWARRRYGDLIDRAVRETSQYEGVVSNDAGY